LSAASATAADEACSLQRIGELPVTMSGRQPIVTGAINGIEARFLVDSGSFFSLLPADAKEKFGLKSHKKVGSIPVAGVGGFSFASAATADRFSLAGLELGEIKNVDFVLVRQSVGYSFVGIIGQNVLGIADTEYDLANGVVRIFRPIGCKNKSLAYWKKSAPIAILEISDSSAKRPHILGFITLNGQKIRVMFDTGASFSMLTRSAAARAGIKPGDPGVVDAGYAGGIGNRGVKTWIAQAQSLDLGEEVIKNAKLRVGDTDLMGTADLLLGADFFLSHRVYVAKSQGKVYFSYNGGPVFDLSVAQNDTQNDTQSATEGDTVVRTEPESRVETDAPKDAGAFRRRGAASLSRNDVRGALADFDQAIKLDPNDAENYRQRALAYASKKDRVAAKEDFDRALTLKPDSSAMHFERGALHISANDANAALTDFKEAIRLAPNDDRLGLQLAFAFGQIDRPEEKIELLNTWLDAFPKHDSRSRVLNERCWARATMDKELQLALTDCNAAIDLKRSPMYYDSRGLVYLRLGNAERSIDDYKRALRSSDDDPMSLFGLGLATIKQGDQTKGQKYIAEALAKDPKVQERYKKMGLEP
ncbi:MAG TPA: aspartyl protease family protein, partial [Steroidobacteraceae bacterium]|nr:aspartyl protease family protein [Steroidobacteraceae bacterium]